MGRRNRQANKKAARARAGKAKKAAQSATHNESKAKKHVSLAGDVSGLAGDSGNTANTAPTALEECDWDGSVNVNVPEGWMTVTDYEDDLLSELEGNDLIESLRSQMCKGAGSCEGLTGYQEIQKKISTQQWKKAERNRGLGYNGLSNRTQRRIGQQAREKASKDEVLRKR